MLQIIKNPDNKKYLEITEAVKQSLGFCPCELIRNDDTKCICKSFREQTEEGECHCGRFLKIEVNDNE